MALVLSSLVSGGRVACLGLQKTLTLGLRWVFEGSRWASGPLSFSSSDHYPRVVKISVFFQLVHNAEMGDMDLCLPHQTGRTSPAIYTRPIQRIQCSHGREGAPEPSLASTVNICPSSLLSLSPLLFPW